MSTATPQGTLWVCDDCLFAREGDGTENPDREPWGLEPDTDVTAGLTWDEHSCGDAEANFRDGIECECEQIEFTWSDCEGCGSTLAGGMDHRRPPCLNLGDSRRGT